MQQRGNKNKNCCISLPQYNTDLIWRNCQTCEIILVYMNYFLSRVAFYSSYMYMFCVELCLQGKKSFSMILYFIISFLDFDKTSTYTKKKLSCTWYTLCSEHLLKIHCWKGLQSTGRGFKHFRLSQHIFSSPYCVSYNALFFLMDKCTVSNMLRRHCTRFLRLFSSTLITLVFNVTCHCSMITQVHIVTYQ